MINLGTPGSARSDTNSELPGQQLQELLLACHQRIGRFSSTARRLLQSPEASDAEISDAAQRVYRYFVVAFPLHMQDEDDSIKPRLAQIPDPDLQNSLATMSSEHEQADEFLETLIPAWKEMISHPEQARQRAQALLPVTNALIQELEAHLKLEEELIFPRMLDHLSDDDFTEILREFRERRKDKELLSGPPVSAVVGLSTP